MQNRFVYIDVTYLIEMSDNNPLFIGEIVDVFKIQVKEMHQVMLQRLDAADYIGLQAIFHKAKSAMSVMGMHEMVESLKKMEEVCISEQDNYDIKKFIDRFDTICHQAIKELDVFVKKI